MIEYAKQILPKVCNWKDLFRKELIKCVEWASPDEQNEIYVWCYRYFADLHSDVLEEVFTPKMKRPLHINNRKNEVKTIIPVLVYKNPDFIKPRRKEKLKNQVGKIM